MTALFIMGALASGCSEAQSQNAHAQAGSGSGCKISLVDENHFPQFTVNEEGMKSAEDMPGTRKAYFAMGCFWGSEAMLGSLPGVVGTRVGLSGGTTPDPSYSNIGDHVETVEVTYDPAQVSFQQLLHHFWTHHNAKATPIFRQYASAVFCLDPKEEAAAKAQRSEEQKSSGSDKLLTAILPFKQFVPAEESHQKYYLRQDKALFAALEKEHLELNSKLATKLNSVAGGDGDRAQLEQTLATLGIESEARAKLFRRAMWPEP